MGILVGILLLVFLSKYQAVPETQDTEDNETDNAPDVDQGTEAMDQAYAHGQPIEVELVVVQDDGLKLEARTAASFIEMRDAAAADGIVLHGNDGWRSMTRQRAEWDRYQAEIAAGVKHPVKAAKPGYSNHQGGYALDISTVDPDGTTGYDSAIYLWLQVNASSYGFANTVDGEPWHWSTRQG